mmetsp:Transcript_29690/g.81286  ORF Transcript_29690/g.81286 Transcript_29690/m.81286 type:complete len:218 (+) Transcript_29690:2844-3497(+)
MSVTLPSQTRDRSGLPCEMITDSARLNRHRSSLRPRGNRKQTFCEPTVGQPGSGMRLDSAFGLCMWSTGVFWKHKPKLTSSFTVLKPQRPRKPRTSARCSRVRSMKKCAKYREVSGSRPCTLPLSDDKSTISKIFWVSSDSKITAAFCCVALAKLPGVGFHSPSTLRSHSPGIGGARWFFAAAPGQCAYVVPPPPTSVPMYQPVGNLGSGSAPLAAS